MFDTLHSLLENLDDASSLLSSVRKMVTAVNFKATKLMTSDAVADFDAEQDYKNGVTAFINCGWSRDIPRTQYHINWWVAKDGKKVAGAWGANGAELTAGQLVKKMEDIINEIDVAVHDASK